MAIGSPDSIYTQDLIKQPDGRYTLIFEENGKLYKQENIALCFSASHQNDTGNDSDTRIYTTHFEVLTCYHPPKEQV